MQGKGTDVFYIKARVYFGGVKRLDACAFFSRAFCPNRVDKGVYVEYSGRENTLCKRTMLGVKK
jgi:hypothetical protein